MQTLVIVIFGYRDAAYSVSPIADVFTKGFDDGSQDMSVKIGMGVGFGVEVGALVDVGQRVDVGLTVAVGLTGVGVSEITVLLQPARNKVIVSKKI